MDTGESRMNIRSRIEKLEVANPPGHEPVSFIVVEMIARANESPGRLLGVSVSSPGSQFIPKPEGESEREFFDRIEGELIEPGKVKLLFPKRAGLG